MKPASYKKTLTAILPLLGTLGASSQAVHAEEEKLIQLEEVVVTARFRKETAQDIGSSIKALSGRRLAELGMKDVSDLAAYTPSLSLQERGPNRNEISIRGVGRSLFQQDRTPAPPNVGLYFDDIPVNVIVGSQMDIRSLDIGRVEVVRGPQGTLFGEGAQGGAIRYFSADPDFENWSGSVEANVNTIQDGGTDFGGSLTVNAPFSETSGLRLSVGRVAQAGFIDNTFDGVKDVNDYDVTTFRGVFLAEPNENLRIRISGHYEDFNQGAFVSSNPQDPSSREYSHASTKDNFVKEESSIISANISYDFDKITVQSITGYFERKRERNVLDHFFTNNELVGIFFADLLGVSNAVLGGPFPLNDVGVNAVDNFKSTQFSQEFRFISNFDGPVNFVAGAFYRDFGFDLEGSIESDLFVTALPFYLGNLDLLGIPHNAAPANPSNNLSELAGQLGLGGLSELNNAPVIGHTSNDGEQISLFGEVTVEISDALKVIGGVRWHKEDIVLEQVESASSILNILSPVVPFPFAGEASVNVVLPKFSVEWMPNDNILTYFTYSEGVRNGNVNGSIGSFVNIPGVSLEAANKAASFGKELAKSFELGLKSTWLDDRLQFNAALYRVNLKDVQGTAQVVDPVSASVTGATGNIGDGQVIPPFLEGFKSRIV